MPTISKHEKALRQELADAERSLVQAEARVKALRDALDKAEKLKDAKS